MNPEGVTTDRMVRVAKLPLSKSSLSTGWEIRTKKAPRQAPGEKIARRAAKHLGQIGVAHQEAVAFAGGAATFVDRPDDEALAAAAVAGREDVREVRPILLVLGF